MKNQVHYQSLVRQAWEEYQQDNHVEMGNLLKHSLEFTPYLKARTISDWVDRFAKLAQEDGDCFDADVFSNLPEWDQVIERVIKDKDKDKNCDSFMLEGYTLWKLLQQNLQDSLLVRTNKNYTSVDITSTNEKVIHIKLEDAIPVNSLVVNGVCRIFLDSTGTLSLSIVAKYQSGQEQLRHERLRAGAWRTLNIPKDATHVEFLLRIGGNGVGKIRAIALRDFNVYFPAKHQTLILTNAYPSESRLYQNSFVHRRVVEWVRNGTLCSVMIFNPGDIPREYVFEDIPVWVGREQELQSVLKSGVISTVIVHFLNEKMWDTIKEYINKVRIVVFLHGAEVQAWHRRYYALDNSNELVKAIEWSAKRMAFWKSMFENPAHNLKFIFVSRYLAQCALEDTKAEFLGERYFIVNNYIDRQLFNVRAEDDNRRFRILSIRPFSSKVYANDLIVKVIERLSELEIFSSLSFLVVGAGKYFSETVAPLRKFPNLHLLERFLPQVEIAELHQQYGIFLVPSRMDTQGVSRDEAMSSGMVAVTNRVAAVPEFVDENSTVLVDPEDVEGMAEGIRQIVNDVGLFRSKSSAAVASIQARYDTIKTEQMIAMNGAPGEQHRFQFQNYKPPKQVAIYGDVNLNILDGSAVWAASLAESFAKVGGIKVYLFLKAKIQRPELVKHLRHYECVHLIEPITTHHETVDQALDLLESFDYNGLNFDVIIFRGFNLVRAGARRNQLRNRVSVYLTDIPQDSENVSEEWLAEFREIVSWSRYLTAQTMDLADHFESLGCPKVKVRLLPPIIPDINQATNDNRKRNGIIYAGKFAPQWCPEEMLEIFAIIHTKTPSLPITVFGDKVHRVADDRSFQKRVTDLLEAGNRSGNFNWVKRATRSDVLSACSNALIGWAWRDPAFEAKTLELSTKVLEYAVCGCAPVLARNRINEDLLGVDYPLFAQSKVDALNKVIFYLEKPELLEGVANLARSAASKHTMSSVYANYLSKFFT